jgi:indolepyruvate ferredoxin oxidoreductase
VTFPQNDLFTTRLQTATKAGENVYLDALALAGTLFGSHLMANMMVVGAAYQIGLLPMSADAIEQAIALNRVAMEENQQAFRYGRLLVANPQKAAELAAPAPETASEPITLSPAAQTIINSVGAAGELRRLLEIRVPELIAYQNEGYAREYAQFVQKTVTAERKLNPSETPLSEAVARYLFKLMAYKDEYEVARLSLKPAFQAALASQFGAKVKISYKLHPPFLRAIGVKKKVSFGKWFDRVYRPLYALRRLRHTPFDPFGYAHVRQVERALIQEYRTLIEEELAGLTSESYGRAIQIAHLPDLIRGYEAIKLGNIARFREKVNELRGEVAA